MSPAKRGKRMEAFENDDLAAALAECAAAEALAAWPEADAALVLAEAEAIKTEPLTGESFGKIKDLLKQVPEPVRVLRGLEAAKTAADAAQGEPSAKLMRGLASKIAAAAAKAAEAIRAAAAKPAESAGE